MSARPKAVLFLIVAIGVLATFAVFEARSQSTADAGPVIAPPCKPDCTPAPTSTNTDTPAPPTNTPGDFKPPGPETPMPPTSTPTNTPGDLKPPGPNTPTFTPTEGGVVPLNTPTPTEEGEMPTATDTPEPGENIVGDVDCSGEVNAIDAAFILQYAAGLIDELPCEKNADVNEDGDITSVDAALILQLTAGLIGSLPP